MVKNSKIILCCLICIVLATSTSAQLVAKTDDIPLGSLPEVLEVGDKVFSDFVLNPYSEGIEPNFNKMYVQGVQDTTTGDYGLRFNGFLWSVGSGQTIAVDLSFKVSILPDPNYKDYRIEDVWLYLTGVGAAGTGRVTVGENVWDDFPGTQVAYLYCTYDANGVYLKDHAEFAPLKEIYIQTKYIVVEGGPSGSAHFSEFFQFYSQSQVPEPATLVLLGTAGIWIFTRKKRSA